MSRMLWGRCPQKAVGQRTIRLAQQRIQTRGIRAILRIDLGLRRLGGGFHPPAQVRGGYPLQIYRHAGPAQIVTPTLCTIFEFLLRVPVRCTRRP